MESELEAAGIPCTLMIDYLVTAEHPDYLARHVFTERETVRGEKAKGVDVMPRFERNLGRV